MVKCREICDIMEEIAPAALAESWDNPGLAAGDPDFGIEKILVALDATLEVVNEAITLGADMIITHHPLIFGGLKTLREDIPDGERAAKIIRAGLCVFSAHTNLDTAKGGTNDCLAALLGIENLKPLTGEEEGLGRIGSIEPCSLGEFAQRAREALKLDTLKTAGNPGRMISKIALCTGAGAEFISRAHELGAELYITGDIKFHDAQKALALGLCIMDGTHWATERIIVHELAKILKKRLSGRNVKIMESEINGEPFWEVHR
ncbi:MAG: Nif3-like dinuclear metal center hexameric protein [Firmicutes bacterium]|nr:Nif3-like dinuclear metal center hexameric protein [Bacillota bacterium]